MDQTDAALLAMLREDARRPVASLARALKISRATVQNRIDKLLAAGTIQGFTIRLPPPEATNRVQAVMLLAVTGERAEAVARALRRLPDIQALHSTNGRWDMVAQIDTDTLGAFDQVLARIRKIEGVSATETSLLLAPVLR